MDKDQYTVKQIPIEVVDELADLLVELYSNPDWRDWYCKVIYEFGVGRVKKWMDSASKGYAPAKLFSAYVRQARQSSPSSQLSSTQTAPNATKTEPAPTQGDVDAYVGKGIDEYFDNWVVKEKPDG